MQTVQIEIAVLKGIVEFVAEGDVLRFEAEIYVSYVFAHHGKQRRIVGDVAQTVTGSWSGFSFCSCITSNR